MAIRYVRDEELFAEAIRSTRRGVRDVQRPTGTERAQTAARVVAIEDEQHESSRVPLAPTGLVVIENEGFFDERGRPFSRVRVGWSAVTTGVDGEPITAAAYDVWVSVDGGVPQQRALTQGTEVALELDPDVPVVVTARAQASVGVLALGTWSEHSAPLPFTPALVSVEPGIPSAPVGDSELGVVIGFWDGLLGTTVPAPGFAYVFAEWAPDGAPEESFKVFGVQLRSAGQVTLPGQAIGITALIRFRSVDTLGRVSLPGPTTAVEIVGVTGPDIEADSITGNNMRAGTLEVVHVSPSFGDDLTFTANASIDLIVGVAVDVVQDNLDGVADSLAATQTRFQVRPDGAYVGNPGLPLEVGIKGDRIQMLDNTVPIAEWVGQQMIVKSVVTDEIVMGNLKVEKYGSNSTVFRRL